MREKKREREKNKASHYLFQLIMSPLLKYFNKLVIKTYILVKAKHIFMQNQNFMQKKREKIIIFKTNNK